MMRNWLAKHRERGSLGRRNSICKTLNQEGSAMQGTKGSPDDQQVRRVERQGPHCRKSWELWPKDCEKLLKFLSRRTVF